MADRSLAAFVVKAAIADPAARHFAFERMKTMYGGRAIAAGDRLFVFHSEAAGGRGLIACARVTAAESVSKPADAARATPRVTVAALRIGDARQALGRVELRGFDRWDDGRAETELNFKLYRQATDKIAGVSAAAAAFLDGLF